MKKVILMVAMVFATSSLVNANTNTDNYLEVEVDKYADCDIWAITAGAFFELTYEEEHEVFDSCMQE